ncbi:hypothetical protein D3C85_677290 [compost metagenome]
MERGRCGFFRGLCRVHSKRPGLSLVSWVGTAGYLAEAFVADALRAGVALGGAIMVIRALSRA